MLGAKGNEGRKFNKNHKLNYTLRAYRQQAKFGCHQPEWRRKVPSKIPKKVGKLYSSSGARHDRHIFFPMTFDGHNVKKQLIERIAKKGTG